MKKYGRIVCAVILVVSMLLTSMPVFAAGETTSQSAYAYKMYQTAFKKIQKAQSLLLTGKVKLSMEAYDTTYGESSKYEESVKFESRVLYNEYNKLQMSTVMKYGDLELAQYYKDGYLYVNYDGTKAKAKASEMDSLTMSGVLPDIPRELFDYADVEAVNGGNRIKLMLDNERLNELLNGLYPELGDMLSEELDSSNVKLKILVYITIGNDGNIKTELLALHMNMSSGESTVKLSMSVALNVVSTNKLTKIDYPSDLKSYTLTNSGYSSLV